MITTLRTDIAIEELNKIYNEDCLDGMKRIPDNTIDLTVTSPPPSPSSKPTRKIRMVSNSWDVKEAREKAWQAKWQDD